MAGGRQFFFLLVERFGLEDDHVNIPRQMPGATSVSSYKCKHFLLLLTANRTTKSSSTIIMKLLAVFSLSFELRVQQLPTLCFFVLTDSTRHHRQQHPNTNLSLATTLQPKDERWWRKKRIFAENSCVC